MISRSKYKLRIQGNERKQPLLYISCDEIIDQLCRCSDPWQATMQAAARLDDEFRAIENKLKVSID